MLSVYRAERRKLLAQLSTRVLALICALGPLAFGAVLGLQSGLPADSLLGVWVHASGYAGSLCDSELLRLPRIPCDGWCARRRSVRLRGSLRDLEDRAHPISQAAETSSRERCSPPRRLRSCW